MFPKMDAHDFNHKNQVLIFKVPHLKKENKRESHLIYNVHSSEQDIA